MTTQAHRNPWLIAIVGGLFFFYNFIQMTLFNPLAEPLMSVFRLEPTEFGAISAGFFLAVAIVALPAGMLADKFKTKRLLLILLAGTIGISIGTAHTQDPGLLSTLRFAQGMIHAFALTLPIKLALQWIPPQRMAVASSLIVTLGLFGGALSQPMLTFFNENYGLTQALMYNAYIGMAVWVLFLIFVHDNREFWETHHSPSWGEYLKGIRVSIFNRQNWLGGFYVCLLNLPLILLGAGWGQLYMEHTWGVMGEQASFIIGLIFIGVICGTPLLGFLSDKIHSRKRPMYLGTLTSILVFAPLLLGIALGSWVLILIFFVLGITTSSQVVVYPMVTECNPPKYTGTAVSILTLVIMGGNALAQVVFGWLIDMKTTHTAWGPEYMQDSFAYGMWMMWGALVISIAVIFFMRETFHKHQ